MYFCPSSVCTRAASSRRVAASSFFTVPSGPLWHPPSKPSETIRTSAGNARSGRIGDASFELATELRLAPRAIHDLPLELAAGRVDVVAARAPHHRQHVGVQQDLLERPDVRFIGTFEARA